MLQKNALYRVKVTANIANAADKNWKNLFLKIFTIPGSEIFYQKNRVENIFSKEAKWDFRDVHQEKNFLLVEKS